MAFQRFTSCFSRYSEVVHTDGVVARTPHHHTVQRARTLPIGAHNALAMWLGARLTSRDLMAGQRVGLDLIMQMGGGKRVAGGKHAPDAVA